MNLLYRMKQAAIRLCGGYYEPRTTQEGQDGALLLEISKEYEAVHKMLSEICYNHNPNESLLSLAQQVVHITGTLMNAKKGLPVVHVNFETESNGLYGVMHAPLKRVSYNDDGSISVALDYWPPPYAR